jgi:hypothetical protein
MCDTYVDGVGYVCWECKEEFKLYLEEMNEDETKMYQNDIKLRLEHFMKTEKDTYTQGEIVLVDDFFSSYDQEGD